MNDSRWVEGYDVPGIARTARSLRTGEPRADGRRADRVLGVRRSASDEGDEYEDVGYERTRPLKQRSWRRRLARSST